MATTTTTSSVPFVQWQVHSMGIWTNLDRNISREMEDAFRTPAKQSVQIAVVSKSGTTQETLDLRQMTWAGFPLRRCKNDTATTRFLYWDDEAWMPYCEYAQSLFSDATKYGRAAVGLYIGDKEYDIILDNADPMQINRNTSRKRPIRVIGSTTTADDDDDDDSIADDESMPPEFRCPIMQMPMSKPVIAADGHSYEKKAIERWLLTKNTSPVTGKALAHAELTLNHNLRKLIRDHVDGEAASPSPAAALPAGKGMKGKKRMRMCVKAHGEGSSSSCVFSGVSGHVVV